jgi:hypothetical protein
MVAIGTSHSPSMREASKTLSLFFGGDYIQSGPAAPIAVARTRAGVAPLPVIKPQ